MVISSDFGVLWSDGVSSGASSWFHMGTGETLLMVIVTHWCTLVLQWDFRSEMNMCGP